MKAIEIRPPRMAQLLLLVAFALHWTVPLPVYANPVLGALCVAGGFWLMLAGWWLFRRYDTPICPTYTPSSFITEGVYRVTRNPMYLGIVAMLLGIAFMFGTLPFYVAALVWFVVIDVVFVRYEEARLLAEFGDEFERYRTRVRRWI